MLSKKEKLLVRPWQQRRYENHRRKVQSALPVVDNRPPPIRQHVDINLKKLQKENERCAKIERENMILLRRLNYVMKTNRVDNYWRTPQPNFLNRVAAEKSAPKTQENEFEPSTVDESVKCSHLLKCPVCTPEKKHENEERVPWEPEKLPASTRLRSKSVPARLILPTITEKQENKKAQKVRHKSGKTDTKRIKENEFQKTPNSIIITRGALKLAVNFPSDSLITFRNGTREKLLMRDCNCTVNAPAVF